MILAVTKKIHYELTEPHGLFFVNTNKCKKMEVNNPTQSNPINQMDWVRFCLFHNEQFYHTVFIDESTIQMGRTGPRT